MVYMLGWLLFTLFILISISDYFDIFFFIGCFDFVKNFGDSYVVSCFFISSTGSIILKFGFLYNSFSQSFRDGNNFSLAFKAIAMCIAVGKTSLVDWDLFT